jgi:hypothetical protein
MRKKVEKPFKKTLIFFRVNTEGKLVVAYEPRGGFTVGSVFAQHISWHGPQCELSTQNL